MWKHFTPVCIETLWQKLFECALEKHSDYSAKARKIIVELNKICLNNVVTQYGDQLYIQKNGIITGDNHSVSLANIAVHYILQPIADVLNEAEFFRRFIDDIIWISASEISNERIRQALTSAFENSGLELPFRQACTSEKTGEVEFLDVNHCVTIEDDFVFVTKTHRGGKAIHKWEFSPPANNIQVNPVWRSY